MSNSRRPLERYRPSWWPEGEPLPPPQDGLPGQSGADGAQGERGETGATGADGAQGERGETGATGADGETQTLESLGAVARGETPRGRYKAGFSYRFLGGSALQSSSIAIPNGTLFLLPWFCRTTQIIDRLFLRVTVAAAAGGVARWLLYNDDGSGAWPGALAQDFGTVATNTTGVLPFNVNYTPAAPLVWIGALITSPGTNATFTGVRGSLANVGTLNPDAIFADDATSYTQTGLAAPPAVFGGTGTTLITTPICGFRIAP